MLPGVRFLFAAVVLAVSLLIFGLGAAALLRSAHEQFANAQAMHPPPMALPSQPAATSLSMLRVDFEEPTSAPSAPPPSPTPQSEAIAPLASDQADAASMTPATEATPEPRPASAPESAIAGSQPARQPASDPSAPLQQAESSRQEGVAKVSEPAAAAAIAPALADALAVAGPAPTTTAGVDPTAPIGGEARPAPEAPKSIQSASPQPEPVAAAELPEAVMQTVALSGPVPSPKRDPRPTRIASHLAREQAAQSVQSPAPEAFKEPYAAVAPPEHIGAPATTQAAVTTTEDAAKTDTEAKPAAGQRPQVHRKRRHRVVHHRAPRRPVQQQQINTGFGFPRG